MGEGDTPFVRGVVVGSLRGFLVLLLVEGLVVERSSSSSSDVLK